MACNFGDKYAQFGLGRGINGAYPTRIHDVVVCPHWKADEKLAKEGGFVNVETVLPQVRYKRFVTNIWSESKLTREFRLSLSTADIFQPISIDFDFGFKRASLNKLAIVALGHQIHNRSYRFNVNAIQNAQEETERPECPAVDCLVDKYLRELPEYNDQPTDERRFELATEVIKDKCQGITHFVSAIHMGAKVFTKQTTHLVKDTETIDANFDLKAANLAQFVAGFDGAKSGAAAQATVDVVRMHNPTLKMEGAKTKIEKEEEECLISYDVLPISVLIHDPKWRKAVTKASNQLIAEEVSGGSTALIDTDLPLFIQVGTKKYLQFIETDDPEEPIVRLVHDRVPTPVSIDIGDPDSDSSPDPLEATDVPFYLAFKSRSGMNHYFSCATNEKLVLSEVLQRPNRGILYLVHPATGDSVPLKEWSKVNGPGYAIAVRKGFPKRNYFLVVDEEKEMARFDSSPNDGPHKYFQFKIFTGIEEMKDEMMPKMREKWEKY